MFVPLDLKSKYTYVFQSCVRGLSLLFATRVFLRSPCGLTPQVPFRYTSQGACQRASSGTQTEHSCVVNTFIYVDSKHEQKTKHVHFD